MLVKDRVAGSHLVACDREEFRVNYLRALPLGLKPELTKAAFPVS